MKPIDYIESVAVMIKTGASEDTVTMYIEKLYINGKIINNLHELLYGIIRDNY